MSVIFLLKVEYICEISTKEVILRDVLYILGFKYNLLSVNALLKDKIYYISFSNVDCIIQDKLLLKIIRKVEHFNGLYLLRIYDEKSKSHPIQHIALTRKASTSIWHIRMGHRSFSRIKELTKLINISDSLNYKEVYHVCSLAKHRRLSFLTFNNVVEHIFDLVHCHL